MSPASIRGASKKAEDLGKEKEQSRKPPVPANFKGEGTSEAANTPNVTKEPKSVPKLSKQTGKGGWSTLKQISRAVLKDGSPSQSPSKANSEPKRKASPMRIIETSGCKASANPMPALADQIMKRKAVDPPEAVETPKKKPRSALERQLFPSSPLEGADSPDVQDRGLNPTAPNSAPAPNLEAFKNVENKATISQNTVNAVAIGTPVEAPKPNRLPSPTAAQAPPNRNNLAKEVERIIVDRLAPASKILFCVKFKNTEYQE